MGRGRGEVHVSVRTGPGPRFVFRFEKDPECRPLVYQVQGSVKQPVFTCKFGFRNTGADRSRSSNRLPTFDNERAGPVSERAKGVVDHHTRPLGFACRGSVYGHALCSLPRDQSRQPVEAQRLARAPPRIWHVAAPRAWLVLRPGYGMWKPWGRLEAWCERGPDDLSYRFELLPGTSAPYAAAATAISTVSIRTSGKFTLDTTTSVSPASSPGSSMDLGSTSWSGSGSDPGTGIWSHLTLGGFVMSAGMSGVDEQGLGPKVEVGVQKVTCTEAAAASVALMAALDLSMDACRLFSQKLRIELRQQSGELLG